MKALLAASLLFAPLSLQAAGPAKEDAEFSAKLVTALEKADYTGFTEDGTEAMKGMKKEQFDAVSAQLGPKLKTRTELSYLGELKQQGFRVTLWKITFKDGSDDALVTLSVKDGKVGGFLIR